MDLIVTNKDEIEVTEIILTGCASAILGPQIMKNMLVTAWYVKLAIV